MPAASQTSTGTRRRAAAVATSELIRSLGAVVLTPPGQNQALYEALGLPMPTGAEYTEVFVLSAPPHGAIHLGPEGKLGGEGLDRIAGFWRALGLVAPTDADHLGTLLMLYAELVEAEGSARDERAQEQMRRARTALFHEHIWSWAPGYLDAVQGLQVTALTSWSQLSDEVLRAEYAQLDEPETLPLAMRLAPEPLGDDHTLDETLDALVAPIRSGFVLTHRDLTICAGQAGVGLRRGERRFALRAMLEQDAPGTLGWLAEHAHTWSGRHGRPGAGSAGAWWSERAAHSARTLRTMAGQGQQLLTAADED